jgi:hypothetical protein
MIIAPAALDEFIAIYKEEFGEEIDRREGDGNGASSVDALSAACEKIAKRASVGTSSAADRRPSSDRIPNLSSSVLILLRIWSNSVSRFA